MNELATPSETRLAVFVQAVMNTPPTDTTPEGTSGTPGSSGNRDYHLEFYQQLPDLVLAILSDGPDMPQHVTRFGALLYHMVGCTTCHNGYLELYDCLGAALAQPSPHSPVQHQTDYAPSLRALPSSALEQFCRMLITQAEAVVSQSTKENREGNLQAARQLLQRAIGVGGAIHQRQVRQRALADLVRVALLAEPQLQAASPSLSYVLDIPQGALRSGHTLQELASDRENAIVVRCGSLMGLITQREHLLSLRLQGLDESMHGRKILVSFPLGTLFEPIRWNGSPQALLSPTLIREDGTVDVPLGETKLHLTVPAERSLLEVLFLLFEARVAGGEG